MGVRQIIFIVLGLIAFTSQFSRIFSMKTHMKEQSVLLVTAHPDDETMFFGPTVRHVVNNGNDLHFLVLSNGNAEGLGSVREQEMKAVAPLLGSKEENVVVVDDPKLQDGEQWDAELVSQYIKKAIEDTKAASVITFDAEGGSGHHNHKACFEGALLAAYGNPDVSLLTLYSVPLWRKYLFSLDTIVSRTITLPQVHYTLISGSVDYSMVRRALSKAHKSQMVWFRHLWSMFSRYMIVNDLCEIDLGHGLKANEMRNITQPQSLEPRGSKIQTAVEMPKRTKAPSAEKTPELKPVTRHRPGHDEL